MTKSSSKSVQFLFVIVISLLILAAAIFMEQAKLGQYFLPTWNPNPALLSKLNQNVSPLAANPHFTLSTPKEYLRNMQLGEKRQLFAFKTENRTDGTTMMFLVVSFKLNNQERKELNQSKLMEKILLNLKAHMSDWKQSKLETGKINNAIFTRTYWSGRSAISQKTCRGFAYSTLLANDAIMITAQDAESHANESLPLAEAAALTYKLLP